MRMAQLLLTAAILLALPVPASAATVTYQPPREYYKGAYDPAVVTVQAASGEANDIRVEAANGQDRFVIRDFGAVLEPGACERLDDHSVRCPPASVLVLAGDRDDRVGGDGIAQIRGGDGDDVLSGATHVAGDAGDDRLTGPPGHYYSYLDGGPGDDLLVDGAARGALRPGPGRDTVAAGEGDDIVVDDDAERGADRFDGGRGTDTLKLGSRADGARIDLATQTSSDGDALAGFEGASGGRGDDVIAGSDGPNWIAGGPGQDRLVGADGDDRLQGGGGFDHFDAGAGDDRIDARRDSEDDYTRVPGASGDAELDARPEPIACGPGQDVIVDLYDDLVGPDCERLPHGLRPRPVAVRPSSVDLVIPCRRAVGGIRRRCEGTVTVQSSSLAQATLRFSPARERFSFRGAARRVRVRADVGSDATTFLVRYRTGQGFGVRWTVAGLR